MSWTWFWRSGWWTTENVWQLPKGVFASGSWHCTLAVMKSGWKVEHCERNLNRSWHLTSEVFLPFYPPSPPPPTSGRNNHKSSLAFCRNAWPRFCVISVYTWINPKLTLGTAGYSWPCEFKYEMHWNIGFTRLLGNWVVLFSWISGYLRMNSMTIFYLKLCYWISLLKCISELSCDWNYDV